MAQTPMGSRVPINGWYPGLNWTIGLTALVGSGALLARADHSGKLLGILSGALLLALVAYGLYRALAPLSARAQRGFIPALWILSAFLISKILALVWIHGYGFDVYHFLSWALRIAAGGPARTYSPNHLLIHPPGDLYALWAVVLVSKLIGAGARIAVESPALMADFWLAVLAFAYAQVADRRNLAPFAMLAVALNPALLYDTLVWGQNDSLITLVMWLTLAAALASEYELAWGLAALSVLIKPQGLLLLPVLGWWTLLKTDLITGGRAAASALAVFIVCIGPFQIGHPWHWIIDLYLQIISYYRETSVNAFNFVALIGGLRQQDSGTIAGVSYLTLGMILTVPSYGFAAYVLWRNQSAKSLFYAAFIALFGCFLFAPRMHERFLYPAVVFAVPLSLESGEMLAVYMGLTVTLVVNLAYAKHALESAAVFLEPYDQLAMLCALVNLAMFAVAIHFGISLLRRQWPAQPESQNDSLKAIGS